MRVKIVGSIYNSEAAIPLALAGSSEELRTSWPLRDLGDTEWQERLMRMPGSGRFFLHVRGGRDSRHAVIRHGVAASGERILPMSSEWVDPWIAASEGRLLRLPGSEGVLR